MKSKILRLDKKNYVKSDQIIFLKANLNYTEIHLNTGKKLMLARTLKRFEEDYQPLGFYRVNRSILVNTHYIMVADKQFQNIKLHDQTQFSISRRRRENLRKVINV